jgi:hypothetical protein
MALPPFVPRPDREGESICTRCFLAVRAVKGECTLEVAQMKSDCAGVDLKAMHYQA